MKTKKTYSTAFAFALILFAFASKAQNASDISSFLSAAPADASKLMQAYTTPLVNSLSYGLTGGWYHTAKTHKTGGVDFGISINTVFIPTSDNYFTPGSLGLKDIDVKNGGFTNNTLGTSGINAQAPTFVGPNDKTTYTSSYDPGGGVGPQTVSFNGPGGFDLKRNIGFAALPAPMAQIGIGLIKNTDIKIRYVPSLHSNSANISMFGIGLMHDIKQYIPGIKELPFDLSGLVGFNSVTGSTSFVTSSGNPTSTDGNLNYKFNSWTLQALISKKFSVLTLYAGVGWATISTKIDVTGTYNVVALPAGTFPVKDPVAMNISNRSARLTAGMRLKFGPLYLNGDYTFQKYNTVSVGLGVSIR